MCTEVSEENHFIKWTDQEKASGKPDAFLNGDMENVRCTNIK
mgnify:CR=1 FL=1